MLLHRVFAAFVALSAPVALGYPIFHALDGQELHTGLLKPPPSFRGLGLPTADLDVAADCAGMPADFDLRDIKGLISPVRDQGACGSCWAFAKTAALETAIRSAGGPSHDLSEQELVSCDRNNYGCNGGMLNRNEFQARSGQALESSFRYVARDTACKTGLPHPARLLQFVRVRTVNDEQVKCAIWKNKAAPWITVAAGGGRWSRPPTGDFKVWPKGANNTDTNHVMNAVGWKTINGTTYFIIRNSWGNRWGSSGGRPGGEAGYALMPLGADALGEEVAYAVPVA